MSEPHLYYLRALRERRGYTQAMLAVRSGVQQTTISKLETKRQTLGPRTETALLLARALDVDVERLRFGPDPRPLRSLPAKDEPEASV